MAFTVNIGTDLFGRKRNANLEFGACPTMTELINSVESYFDVEMRSSRPAGYPDIPFKVETLQVYDEILLRWVDLYSSSQQMTNGGQVYCFQPESIWHSDAQDIIPDAGQQVTWTTPVGSPRRARAATDQGVAPALSEKLRSVFYDIDSGNKGYVLYSDLRQAFEQCDIAFTYSTIGELFTQADANRSGHITYDEWVRFAINFPKVIDALFFRQRDIKLDQAAIQNATAANEARLAEERARAEAGRAQREVELRKMYEQQWAEQERARLQAEYEAAKKQADGARVQKELAESRERLAWDKLYYSPSSPSRYGA